MLPRHRVSRAAIELIKRFEGYRRHSAQLPDGRWTIGYGHTLTAREGAEVSEADAEALLVYDLISVAHAVNEFVFAPISQNQFDALCSFAFNIGLDNFRRSQVLKRLNAGSAVQAACAMELWRKADFEGERIVLDALVRRRAAEKALFLTPRNDAWVPAPSPLLRPAIDLDALDLVPMRRPVELETSFEGHRITVRREDPEEDVEPDEETWPLPAHSDAPAPSPVSPAIRAAAEKVSARLGSIFPDPGDEPELEDYGAPPPLRSFTQRPAFVAPPAPPRAEFVPPVDPQLGDDEDDGDFDDRMLFEPDPEPDAGLEIPRAPDEAVFRPPLPAPEAAPYDFIPARKRPAPKPREASVAWDLALALLGLAFFGFGVFWGLSFRGVPTGGFVSPLMVAWPAGLAGVGFVVVAVFRLLQRLGREVERD